MLTESRQKKYTSDLKKNFETLKASIYQAAHSLAFYSRIFIFHLHMYFSAALRIYMFRVSLSQYCVVDCYQLT